MSATLGAGALTMPAAMNFGGYLGLIFILILILFVSWLSILLTVHSMSYSGLKSFEEMSLRAYGHVFATFYEIVVVVFCFGTALGYLMSIYDIYSVISIAILSGYGYSFDEENKVINPSTTVKLLTNRAFVITIVTVCVCLPLSLMKKINQLRFTSFLGVSAIFFLTLTMDTHLCVEGKTSAFKPQRNQAWPVSFKSFISAFSLGMFAFACQPNVPAIYAEMKQPTSRKMTIVSLVGLLIALTVYIFMAFGGFFSFGDRISGSILAEFQTVFQNWDLNRGMRIMEMLAFGGMSFAVMFAYPLNVFPTRFSIESLVTHYWPHLNSMRETIGTITSLTTVALTLLLAIFVAEVSVVFDLLGCTAGCACSLITPGFLYLKFSPRPQSDFDSVRAISASLPTSIPKVLNNGDKKMLNDNIVSPLGMNVSNLSPRSREVDNCSEKSFIMHMSDGEEENRQEEELSVLRPRRSTDNLSLSFDQYGHSNQPGILHQQESNTEMDLPEFSKDPTIPRTYNRQVKLFRIGAYFLIIFGCMATVIGTACWIWNLIDPNVTDDHPGASAAAASSSSPFISIHKPIPILKTMADINLSEDGLNSGPVDNPITENNNLNSYSIV